MINVDTARAFVGLSSSCCCCWSPPPPSADTVSSTNRPAAALVVERPVRQSNRPRLRPVIIAEVARSAAALPRHSRFGTRQWPLVAGVSGRRWRDWSSASGGGAAGGEQTATIIRAGSSRRRTTPQPKSMYNCLFLICKTSDKNNIT